MKTFPDSSPPSPTFATQGLGTNTTNTNAANAFAHEYSGKRLVGPAGEHPAVDPRHFQVENQCAKAFIDDPHTGDALKRHVGHYYGNPPFSVLMKGLFTASNRSDRWGPHMKRFIAEFGNNAFHVADAGNDGAAIYAADIWCEAAKKKRTVALHIRFDTDGTMKAMAAPGASAIRQAELMSLSRRALDSADRDDMQGQMAALTFFTRERMRALPEDVRQHFHARLRATQGGNYPSSLQALRAKADLALWACAAAGRSIAEQRIASRLDNKNLKSLDLSFQRLSDLPDEAIGQLTELRELDLSGNAFTTPPACLSGLGKLERLALGSQRLPVDSPAAKP